MSLPLMRKTFIEASLLRPHDLSASISLFRLCGRLSLRHVNLVLYVVTDSGLFRLCGRLSLRPDGPARWASINTVSSADAEDFH